MEDEEDLVGNQEQRVRAARDLLLDPARLNELVELMPPAPVAAQAPPSKNGEK